MRGDAEWILGSSPRMTSVGKEGAMTDKWLELNKASWNERAPIHVRSSMHGWKFFMFANEELRDDEEVFRAAFAKNRQAFRFASLRIQTTYPELSCRVSIL